MSKPSVLAVAYRLAPSMKSAILSELTDILILTKVKKHFGGRRPLNSKGANSWKRTTSDCFRFQSIFLGRCSASRGSTLGCVGALGRQKICQDHLRFPEILPNLL